MLFKLVRDLTITLEDIYKLIMDADTYPLITTRRSAEALVSPYCLSQASNCFQVKLICHGIDYNIVRK